MKVLQINSVCGIGSTGRIATDIHNSLIEHGHDSYIAYGRGRPINCDNAIRIGTKIDNYFHVAKTRIFDKHGLGSKRSTKKFIKKLKEIDPDIIHLHNIHGYYVNIEMLFDYLKETNKHVIWTLHDCWSFTGHCSHFEYVGCEKWRKECKNCPQKKEYPKSLIIDNSEWNYNKKREIFTCVKNMTIVTPSIWLADLVKESFLGGYEIATINNGIDLSIFKPTASDFRDLHQLKNKFIILGVSNIWNKRKGFYEYIEMSKALLNDEVIVLVGVTECQKKDLPINVIGINKTKNVNELVEIYSSADVFVNLTLEDNYPTVNLEAITCGTFVISYNTGGCKETINEGKGIVVEKNNLNNILDALRKFKRVSKKYADYGADNDAKHSKENMLEKYDVLYNFHSSPI